MYFQIKRFFDVIFSLLLIIILLPLMIVIALTIKITSQGPVFFKQARLGKQGVPFNIIKFRTMVVGAEKQGTGLDTYKGDSRVTNIGAFLRNTSLDELPQLFNILKGEMSFIGPRPPVIYHPYRYEEYPSRAKRRFEVKPGVTGLAQISGRNELDWPEKFKYDEEYINKKGTITDLKILFLTILKVIKMEGSYDQKKEKQK
ncbi:sugar transferase [Salinicoccus roseus]|uniref:Sugar transferase n=1 Tax=Salinicoccus roseus TaxID=45670 RepID=A0A265E5M4_9STAP|nr:sugar transferase [Salinicoccus roseus]OZT76873.1 sugar transferase [Salinicoccus roseus]